MNINKGLNVLGTTNLLGTLSVQDNVNITLCLSLYFSLNEGGRSVNFHDDDDSMEEVEEEKMRETNSSVRTLKICKNL